MPVTPAESSGPGLLDYRLSVIAYPGRSGFRVGSTELNTNMVDEVTGDLIQRRDGIGNRSQQAVCGRERRTVYATPCWRNADLDRRLGRVLSLPRLGYAAEEMRRRIARDREHLFVVITDRDVPVTSNICKRALQRA